MKLYRSKCLLLPGSSVEELIKLARREYRIIQKRTPRRSPYVRSKYFKKDKIFISNFWDHLNKKSPKDKVRRLRLYRCGIDALRNITYRPESMQNPNNRREILHRFTAVSKEGAWFSIQIKENSKTGRKDYISVFPIKDKNKRPPAV